MKKSTGKRITIDELATMVGKGFARIEARLDQTATKDDLQVVKNEINERIDRLEKKHERKITTLEEKSERVKEVLKEQADITFAW